MSDAASAPEPETEAIVAALRTVFDPEIPVNVYDLGLIYRVDQALGGRVDIIMTLTAPGCPVAGTLVDMVKGAVGAVANVREIAVQLVFEPPWDTSRMSDEARLELGFF